MTIAADKASTTYE